MSNYAYFVDHCDPPCGLGCFEYECPACNLGGRSFDLWWNHASDKNFSFSCKNCSTELKTYRNEYNELCVSIDYNRTDKN